MIRDIGLLLWATLYLIVHTRVRSSLIYTGVQKRIPFLTSHKHANRTFATSFFIQWSSLTSDDTDVTALSLSLFAPRVVYRLRLNTVIATMRISKNA